MSDTRPDTKPEAKPETKPEANPAAKPEYKRPRRDDRVLLLDEYSIKQIRDRADELRILRKLRTGDKQPYLTDDLKMLGLVYAYHTQFSGDIVYVKPNHRRIEACYKKPVAVIYAKENWGNYHPKMDDLVREFRFILGEALPHDYPYEDHIVELRQSRV